MVRIGKQSPLNQIALVFQTLLFTTTVFFGFLFTSGFAATVKLLRSEVQSYRMRIELIENAQRSVDIASYEIADDNATGRVLASLVQAAERGVCVRILTDGHAGNNNMPKPLMQFLIEHGISIRERPVDVRYQLELGRPRLHDKLQIVDGEHLITGGRNLKQEYFGIGNRKITDCDVYLHGPTARNASAYFDNRWEDPKCGLPDRHREESQKTVKQQRHSEWNLMPRAQSLEQVAKWLQAQFSVALPAVDTCPSSNHHAHREIDDVNIRFLNDFVGFPKRTAGSITPEVFKLVHSARTSIEIVTPYFAISNNLKSILLDATRRGVRVRILTNSFESTDHPTAHAGFANERRWMLKAGIEVFEFQGRNTLHAKLMVIDNSIAMVGSYNFDRLAESKNSDVALIVSNCCFASDVTLEIASLRSHATKIDLEKLIGYERRNTNLPESELRKLRRLRMAAPFIERYL